MTVPFFRCTAFSCVLAVSRCVERHKLAQITAERPAAAQSGPAHGLQRSACRECKIGERHVAGSAPRLWPDGTPIVRTRTLERGDGHAPGTFSAEEKARRQKITAQLHQGIARRKAAQAKATR